VPVELVLVKAVNPPHEPPIKFSGRINVGLNKESGLADAELVTRAGLRFPLRSGLSFNAGFEWDRGTSPAEDAGKSDDR